jgi:hypothetical protein
MTKVFIPFKPIVKFFKEALTGWEDVSIDIFPAESLPYSFG